MATFRQFAFPLVVRPVLLAVSLVAAPGPAQTAETAEPDASGGYVDDAVCATCHAELATSYREVGMARAFGDTVTVEELETWSTPDDPEAGRFFHEPSGRWYEMRRSAPGARPVFRRWHMDEEGEPIDVFETEVDWTLGSGHTSRSYLVHLPGGELFVLPVAWYSQGGHWAMAPGFDAAEHLGLMRRVQRECMFCHNAYPPRVETQPDRHADPHLFPTDLPHGTGCQRCHGPGADHVEAAYVGGLDDAARSRIVNPGRLEAELRDDVCEQCHLQPSVALTPTRRFGRRAYSYRPGEALDEYIVYFDPEEQGWQRSERFEINHHPYRLRQSPCFLESSSATAAPAEDSVEASTSTDLSCLTCHDPHRKVPEPQRVAHYRQACQSCHAVNACGLERMTEPRAALPRHMRGVDAGNCVGCHMPRRRTRDVVHVVMTDHKIARLPGGEDPDADLTAPRDEFTPTLVDMDFYLPGSAPAGALGEVYKAYGVELIGGNAESFEHLRRMLPRSGTEASEPWLQLARNYLQGREGERALEILRRVLEREPDNARALTWVGLVQAPSDLAGAARTLETARERSDFEDPDLLYNLGVVYGHAERHEEALATLRRTVELRPLHAAGWMQLGLLHQRLQRHDEAAEALRRSLEVEPRTARARIALARSLVELDRPGEAERHLRHGLRWGDDADAVSAALRELGFSPHPAPGSGEVGEVGKIESSHERIEPSPRAAERR